jgi:hypothetical protein
VDQEHHGNAQGNETDHYKRIKKCIKMHKNARAALKEVKARGGGGGGGG